MTPYLASLVAACDCHEVHGRHGRRLAEQRDDEATAVVLARTVHVLDLDVEPGLVGDGVVARPCQRRHGGQRQ